MQGGTDTDRPGRASRSPPRSTQLTEGIKEEANATYGGRYLFAGSKTDDAALRGAADTYFGNDAGCRARPGIVREIGPGVSLPINTVGREFLGDGQAADDDKLLDVLRDISRTCAPATAPPCAAPTSSASTTPRRLLERPRPQRRAHQPPRGGRQRLDEIEETTVKQLSETEDADIAKTIIDFNSQTAAYQAALKAGANIVQSR